MTGRLSMSMLRRWIAAGAAATAGVGCAGSGLVEISIEDAAIGASADEIAALYAVIDNRGDRDDELRNATCTCAEGVSMHEIELRDGVSKMLSVDGIDVPAASTTALEPGGAHLMLEGLHDSLRAGDVVRVELEFAHSGAVAIEVPVVEPAELAERVRR